MPIRSGHREFVGDQDKTNLGTGGGGNLWPVGVAGKMTRRKWREGKCNFGGKAGHEKESRKGIEAGRK